MVVPRNLNNSTAFTELFMIVIGGGGGGGAGGFHHINQLSVLFLHDCSRIKRNVEHSSCISKLSAELCLILWLWVLRASILCPKIVIMDLYVSLIFSPHALTQSGSLYFNFVH